MFKFFRAIRRDLLTRKRFANYSLYALGEVALVVVGILIALQINNANDLRKARELERSYLANIRVDLVDNVARIDRFLEARSGLLEDAGVIVEQLDGASIADVNDFNRRCVNIYEWDRFVQVNFTVEELVSSGRLSLITNDRIKSFLFRLEAAYQENKAEEDHLRFDAEELLYKPLYEQLDLGPMLRAYMGEADALSPDSFDPFREDPRIKNGFHLAILEFSKLNEQLEGMKTICLDLIVEIDRELG